MNKSSTTVGRSLLTAGDVAVPAIVTGSLPHQMTRHAFRDAICGAKFIRIVTFVLGCVFYVSAYLKAVRPADTVTALGAAFGPGSAQAVPALHALIVVEIALGALLLANVAPRMALRSALILLAAFTGWIGWLLAIGWTEG